MKPKIRAGQEWEKREREPSPRVTRIRVLEAPFANRVKVGTMRPDGTTCRHRELLVSALSNTPSGYMLVKDAPPEAKVEHQCEETRR